MRSTSFRSAAARAAAVLAAGALALGLAPATAANADGEVAGVAAPRFVKVVDPAGDAAPGDGTTPKPGADPRLADLTTIRYRSPSTSDGDLRIVSRWGVLTDGSKPGARRQVFTTWLESGWARDVTELRVNNVSDRVRISYPAAPGSRPRWLEGATVERTFGPNGRLDLRVPASFISGRGEVSVSSSASSVGYRDGTETVLLAVPPSD